ncbi:glycosyltransferase family 2 protein [Azospirillum sp. ST 5-10]|uniref:glycosyltransferase family 2 protein n=1 Tax=unclassified Azospirillum TaxID=2630922 RepID=UPI003F49BD95
MQSLSVVIPTRDRAPALIETLEACRRHADGLEIEFVVVDLGSRDDTAARLAALAGAEPRLRWDRLEGSASPAAARNRGAALAGNALVLFLGDTARPADAGFFKAHLEIHARFPDRGTAVIGQVGWEDRPGAGSGLLEPLPQAAGGPGELTPYGWHDWRAARADNLSVKRALVDDWAGGGFDAALAPDLDGGALDAVELAWRLARAPAGLRLFHTPAARAVDGRGWSLERLMGRHTAAGGLVRTVLDRGAGPSAADFGLEAVEAALNRPAAPADPGVVADYLAMVEGVKAWTRLFDPQDGTGGAALKPALALAFAEGYLLTAPAGANLAEGCRIALESCRQRIGRVMQSVATGEPLGPGAADAAGWRGPRQGRLARLRAWARQKPALVRTYLWLRSVQGR